MAIVIEIPGIGGPRPSADIGLCGEAYVFESSISQVAVKRISTRMLTIERTNFVGVFCVKYVLAGNAQSSGRPHVGNVDVLFAIVVVVEPAGAHACPDVPNV